MKELRNKKISLVKVLWRNHKTEAATWEVKKRCDNNICNCLTKVSFEDEILLSGGEL